MIGVTDWTSRVTGRIERDGRHVGAANRRHSPRLWWFIGPGYSNRPVVQG
jgi:hypothetical protein